MKSHPSSRILDILCQVCGDRSSGKHYGIYACDGCSGFFKRSIRKKRVYECKGLRKGQCSIDKLHRNQCRACRLQRCLRMSMRKDAVQHERGPRIYSAKCTDTQELGFSKVNERSEVKTEPRHCRSPPMPAIYPTFNSNFHPSSWHSLCKVMTGNEVTNAMERSVPQKRPTPLPFSIESIVKEPLQFSSSRTFLGMPDTLVPPSVAETGFPQSAVLMCEMAARILIVTAKSVQKVFPTDASEEEKRATMERKWPPLFMLSIAPLGTMNQVQLMVCAAFYNVTDIPRRVTEPVREDFKIYQKAYSSALRLHEAVLAIASSTLTEDEVCSLQNDILYSTGDKGGPFACSITDCTSYSTQRRPAVKDLRTSLNIDPKDIVSVFFRRTIGAADISTILLEMIKENRE